MLTVQPPKPPPVMREPSTPSTSPGEFDQNVEFAAADLVVVAHADVRSVHQSPEFLDLAGVERGAGAQHAVVLGDDVAAAAESQFGQRRARAP